MQNDANFEKLARLGYAARGLVYVLTGGMALLSTVNAGEANSRSALELVLRQPLGALWLGLIGVGLAAFVLWRIVQAVYNTDRHEREAKGYAIRAALLVSALTYAGLCMFAVGHALQRGFGGGQADGQKSLAAWLMQQPFGPYLVAVAGLSVLAAGFAQIGKGLKQSYLKYFDPQWKQRSFLNGMCIYGLCARGAILLIVGGFLIYAAVAVDPSQAGSTGEALSWVSQLPFGRLLYALVAFGLFAFGVYSLIEARFRIIDPPSHSRLRWALPV